MFWLFKNGEMRVIKKIENLSVLYTYVKVSILQ